VSFDLKLESGDIKFSPEGELDTVTGFDKLKQDVIKILLTEVGENDYHPWYGSKLGQAVVGRATTFNITLRNVELAVTTSLENLAFLQNEQLQYQTVTPAEAISAINFVNVEREPLDPRQWNIRVSVFTKALTEISEDFSITL